MVWEWIRKKSNIIITVLACIAFLFYCFACESKTGSLIDRTRRVNRQELQLELNQFIGRAQIGMVDLDKQDQIRALILQNALVLVQGQPANPIGILTGIAAIYGITQGGSNITKVVKDKCNKKKANNG